MMIRSTDGDMSYSDNICLSILFSRIYGLEYFIPLGPGLSPKQFMSYL